MPNPFRLNAKPCTPGSNRQRLPSTVTLLVALVTLAPPLLADDAVVGNGGVASCTETALDIALGQLYPGANFPGGVLTFNCGPMPVTIPISSRKHLTGATIIDGGGKVALDGQDSTGIFAINGAQSQVIIRDIDLIRGNAFAAHGGGIQIGADTQVVMSDILIEDSTSQGSGGAIHIAPGATLRIERGALIGNHAAHGGAIASNGSLTVLDSVFEDNRSTAPSGEGGAIQIWFARLDIERTDFSNNRADQGGAILFRGNGSDFSRLIDVTFSANRANSDGGAIKLYENAVVGGSNVQFLGNQADLGGAMSLPGTSSGPGTPRTIGNRVLLTDCRIEGNSANSIGGGAYVFGTTPGNGGEISQLALDRCSVSSNVAIEGGAIQSRGQLLLDDSRFERNAASVGGALSLQSVFSIGDSEFLAYAQLRDLVFRENSATNGGGAIYVTNHLPIYENVRFESNSSVQGGAVYQQGYTTPITTCSFTDNLASDAGGAIYARNTGSIQLDNLVFSGNRAYDVGGRGGDLAIESNGAPGTLISQIQLSNASLIDGVGDSGASIHIVDAQSDLTIRNSIVFGAAGISCDGPGTIFSAGGNFMPVECSPVQATDVVIASRAALQLHPLSNNVGTIAAWVPMAGSPVIDHADCTSGHTSDARGQTAPVDGNGDGVARCDSGAIERQSNEPTPYFRIFSDGFETLE